MLLSIPALMTSTPSYVSPVTPMPRIIAINFFGNGSPSYGGVYWNNIESASPTVSRSNLIYSDDGSYSGIGISFPFSSAGNVSDNGAGWGDGATDGFPPATHRYAFFEGMSVTITLGGLKNSKKYDFNLLGSRSTATHSMTITSGAADSWEAGNNITDSGLLTNLVPSSGTITVVASFTTGSFLYLNAILLTEHN